MSEPVLLVGESYFNQNLYYKTHFLAGDPFVFLQANGSSLLVTSSMEQGRAEKESIVSQVKSFDDYGYRDLLRETGDRSGAFMTVLTRIAQEAGASSLIADSSFPALYADSLRAGGLQLAVDSHLYEGERRRKSADEVSAIEEAQRATEQAVGLAFDLLRHSDIREGILYLDGSPLTSERVRAEIEVTLTRDGMDVSMSPIVAGGPGAADPHWEGHGPLRAGESIVFDVFPRSKRTRYFADMTRTVVRGEPSDILRAMYQATLQAQEAALQQIRAGANGREVHEAAKQAFRDAGFDQEEGGPRYTHGTGHGVGLDIHEGPSLGAVDEELREGDVVTIEPGLYDPTIGAVRIEDIVVVTEDGYRNLTNFPKQFEL
jgi:Xaa-Pro aminopeptidase